jgi:hypothetical protein
MLPRTSDVVRNPEKHPGWTLLGGSTCNHTDGPLGAAFSPFWLAF